MNVVRELTALQRMRLPALRAKYAEVFGEETRSGHRNYLVRKIAWRIQARAEGGLSDRARARAEELADDADLRLTPPANTRGSIPGVLDTRLPGPGTIITREYKGQTIEVKVIEKGFEYEGRSYRSLSAVARAVTGSHWNGYLFFGLAGRPS